MRTHIPAVILSTIEAVRLEMRDEIHRVNDALGAEIDRKEEELKGLRTEVAVLRTILAQQATVGRLVQWVAALAIGLTAGHLFKW